MSNTEQLQVCQTIYSKLNSQKKPTKNLNKTKETSLKEPRKKTTSDDIPKVPLEPRKKTTSDDTPKIPKESRKKTTLSDNTPRNIDKTSKDINKDTVDIPIKVKKPLNAYQLFVQEESKKSLYKDMTPRQRLSEVAKIWSNTKKQV
jgi:hypothetical protein